MSECWHTHVAARSEGGHQVRVKLEGHRAKTLFQHAVKLDRLTRGQSNGAVGDVAGDLVERQPLVG